MAWYIFQNVFDTQYAQSQIPATFFVLEVTSRLNAKMRRVIIVTSQSSVYVSDSSFCTNTETDPNKPFVLRFM